MERFMELVKENDGFELVHAYRDFEDHYLGGKGNTYWYVIAKNDKIKESFIGTYDNNTWKDVHIKGSGAKRKTEDIAPGSTIARISDKAYLMHDEPWVKDKKGKLIEDGHTHLHYVKGFGDKGLDISEKYGVTIAYSDINDVPAGFHLRDLCIGNDVELPE